MEVKQNREAHTINSIEELEELYGLPHESALKKQTSFIVEPGRAFIEASPFLILATAGESGVDCSPKGDAPGFVQLLDENTLLIPDRPGNKRVDGMKNILQNSKVGIIFMIPGSGVTYRDNGNATISTDPNLLDRFLVGDKRPCSVVIVSVKEAFHHCPKAFVRSKLWSKKDTLVDNLVPNTGTFAAYRDGGNDAYAKKYESDYQKRIKETLY